jgi:hypothetical protein
MINYPFEIKNSEFKCIIEAESEEKARERFNILFGKNNDN